MVRLLRMQRPSQTLDSPKSLKAGLRHQRRRAPGGSLRQAPG